MLAELHALDGQRRACGARARTCARSASCSRVPRPGRRAGRRHSSVDPAQVEALIAARKEARAAKNWAESDRIRDELAALGVVVKDNKDGTTTWEVAR